MKVLLSFVAFCIVLGAWQCVPSVKQAAHGPQYALTGESIIIEGFRSTPRTKYTYWAIENGVKRELWTEVLTEVYQAHWIAPSGVVWVHTSSFRGPHSFYGIWARDPMGKVKAIASSRTSTGVGPQPELNLASARVSSMPWGEQASFKMKDGSARSILSIPCEDGNVVSVVRSSSEPALPDRLAEFLEASAADKKPKLTRGAPSVWLWSIPGRPNGIRQNGRLVEVDDLRVLNVEEESNLDLLPFRTIQCAGVHVWFTSGVVRGQEVATAEFWHGQGRQLGKVDLLALTGYRSASELKRDLLLDKWELPKAAAHAMPYELAMRDANGNRYVFNCDTQQGTLKARYLRGLAAREPKELLATDSKVLSEESIWSPNRTFRLRLRHLEGARPDRPRATLLMTVSDSASEVDEVEVWATVRSADALYVSDSGVVVGLNYQERADEDSVELTFWLPEQKFGVKRDLVDLGIFKNIQEARALLDPSQMVIEFSGEKETVTVDGLDLPTRLREDFVFRLKDGSELRAVARGAQPGAVRELTRVHN